MNIYQPKLNRILLADLWAVGCIYAELLALRPIFKGEEAKMEAHHAKAGLQIGAGGILGVKGMPFQRDQMSKIVDVLGTPDGKPLEYTIFDSITS